VSTTTAGAPHPPRTSARAVIAIPCLAIGAVYAAVFVVPPLISPVFVDGLGFRHAQAGLLMTCSTAAYTVASLPAGLLADRVGPRRVLCAGLALGGVASLAFPLSRSFLVLAGLRVAIGIAAGLVYVASVAALRSALDEHRMHAAVGLLLAALNVGVAAAFFLTPLLESALGWEWTFRLVGLACLLALPALALVRAGATAPASGASMPRARIGSLLRDRVLMSIGASLSLTLFVVYGVLTWIPSFWGDLAHLSDSELSLASLALALAGIPSSVVAGAAAARLGRPLGVAAASLVLSLPAAAIALFPGDLVLMAALATVVAFGCNAAAIPLFALPSIVRPADAATVTGLVTTIGMGGAMLSTFLGGVLVELWSYQAAFTTFAVAAGLGAAVVMPLTARAMRGRPLTPVPATGRHYRTR
jgi:MFS transporter, ACS family, hexuronate transporter